MVRLQDTLIFFWQGNVDLRRGGDIMLRERGRELLGWPIPWAINVKPPWKACRGELELEVSSKAVKRGLVLRGEESIADGEMVAVFPRKCLGRHPSTPSPSYPHPHERGQIRGPQEGGEKEEKRRSRYGEGGEKAGAVFSAGKTQKHPRGTDIPGAGGSLPPQTSPRPRPQQHHGIRTPTLTHLPVLSLRLA